MATTKPAGMSVWESELFDYLTEHLETESALLGAYGSLAEASDAEWVPYLAHLVLEEEGRHHRLFTELLNALRATVEADVGPAVPMITRTSGGAELLAATERLIAAEKHDATELRRLRKRLDSMADTSLWPLLVEIMEHDTQKHVAILRFVRRRLREQERRR